MATPTLTRHNIPGALGDILIDVRSSARRHPVPAVLVVHGFKGFKDWGMFPPFSERLARAGFAAVTVSLSGSGVDGDGRFTLPDRFRRNTFSAELGDLQAVLDALDGGRLGVPPPTAVGIVGHSRGGGMAILLAERSRRIQALVTWSAIASVRRWTDDQVEAWRRNGTVPVRNTRTGEELELGTETLDDVERNERGSLDIGGAASRLVCPWLLIHATDDETVPFVEGKLLAAAAPVTARLLPIDGTGHTYGAVHPFQGTGPELERVFDESIRFLSAHLA
ncbi:MAG TPA: alpha/beta fold hydrolase [Gemmatimonadales bacterium]|nr:alpha/beta fold hydrolase [Gemmatimonadales bacterium]